MKRREFLKGVGAIGAMAGALKDGVALGNGDSTKPAPAKNTLLVWVIDETGSMMTRRGQVISGFDEFLQGIRPHQDKFQIMVKRFNSFRTRDFGPMPISEVKELDDYEPTANTPLWDAVGDACERAMAWHKDHSDWQIMVVIQTDGQENASQRRKAGDVVRVIDALRKGGHEIVFLGADIDLWLKEPEMARVGTMTYNFAGADTRPLMASVSDTARAYMGGGTQAMMASLTRTASSLGWTLYSNIDDDDVDQGSP